MIKGNRAFQMAASLLAGLAISGVAVAQSNNTSNNTSTNTSSDRWSSNSSSNSSSNQSRSREGVRDLRVDERIDRRGGSSRYELREYFRDDRGESRYIYIEQDRSRWSDDRYRDDHRWDDDDDRDDD